MCQVQSHFVSCKTNNPLPRISGFSFIEILVALLIISISLMGLLALQTSSLKQNRQAYERSMATILAYDMADRVRANPQGLAAKAYFKAPATNPKTCGSWQGSVSSDCTPAEMAAFDLAQWSGRLASELSPTASGQVCSVTSVTARQNYTLDCSDAAPVKGPYAVQVSWDEQTVSGATQNFVMSFDL